MDIAIALLLLWALLLLPLGLVLHWLVLGEGSRLRALPVAPITGMAVAFVVLSALGRAGIEAGSRWLPWCFVVVSIGCGVLIWRKGIEWRSRELIGSTMLLLFAVLLVQLPVIGAAGDGPLGYGTTANPVNEVAAIDAAAHGPAAGLAIADDARATAEQRPIGFEQFAAMTVAIGRGSDDANSRSPSVNDARWSAYALHSAITGMFVALVMLPLFAFARARGMRWFGLVLLVPIGVVTPFAFLALANGSGAAVASVPFLMAAVFSLLVTRRDRGWWALAVLFGAAAASSAGVLALVPLFAIGIAWMLLRSTTYEHLSQHDSPVAGGRTLAVATIAGGLAAFGLASTLVGGELLAWPRIHADLIDTVRSWPFVWLDTDLSPDGPRTATENVVWLIGPALLAMAAIYAIVRNERRELGVLAGSVAAVLVGALVAFIDLDAGIRLFEFSVLATSPFLAALAFRAVALSRENAEDVRDSKHGRWAGRGPTLIVLAFGLLSIAATSVTGTRMVHAPSLGTVSLGREGATLIAAGDPWLAFVIDGERVSGGYADADALTSGNRRISQSELAFGGYASVVLSSSPLASDPTIRFGEYSDLDTYQVRLFRDRAGATALARDQLVDADRIEQRNRSQIADRGVDASSSATSATGPNTAADPGLNSGSFDVPSRHDPVEGTERSTPPDRPAGRLLPATEVPGCSIEKADKLDTTPVTCEPGKPVLGPGCTAADMKAVRSELDRENAAATESVQATDGAIVALRGAGSAAQAVAKTAAKGSAQGLAKGEEPAALDPNDPQVVTFDSDIRAPRRPTLLGVQCFDIEVDSDATTLLVHLRDVGVILTPERAQSGGPKGAWTTSKEAGRTGGAGGIAGGMRRITHDRGATLTYGDNRLFGVFDIVLEGSFGAGVDLSTTPISTDLETNSELTSFTELRGSADGFSKIERSAVLQGGLTIADSKGTDIELGRLFARPRDLPRSCDVPIALAAGELREVRTESADPTANGLQQRPGITVAIVNAEGEGSDRTARVAVGSYLSRYGLPRHLLVDWTEQYEGELTVEGCDGTDRTEPGAPAAAGSKLITFPGSKAAIDAFGRVDTTTDASK